MSERRCPICNWPMAERREDGCVPDDCSYRPYEGTPEWHRIERNRAAIRADKGRETKMEGNDNGI